MNEIMANPDVKQNAKEASKYVQKLLTDIRKMTPQDIERATVKINEDEYLANAKSFIETEFNTKFEIYSADKVQPNREEDPGNKARFAMPLRPAIYVE